MCGLSRINCGYAGVGRRFDPTREDPNLTRYVGRLELLVRCYVARHPGNARLVNDQNWEDLQGRANYEHFISKFDSLVIDHLKFINCHLGL